MAISGVSSQAVNGANSSSQSQSSTTNNLDPNALAALQVLLQQLQGGGTAAQKGDRKARTQTIQRAQASQQDYSKNAAFDDAQGAMAAQLRQAMQQILPTLVRAAEGSGTSQNALPALLLQQQTAQAAEAAAALGLKASVDYGNVNANIGSILERLTTGADPAQQALIQALNAAKGAQSTTTATGTSTAPSSSGAFGAPSTRGGFTGGSSLPDFGVRDPYAGQSMSYTPPATTTAADRIRASGQDVDFNSMLSNFTF